MKRILPFLLAVSILQLIITNADAQKDLYPRSLDLLISELNIHSALNGRTDMTYANTAGTPFFYPDFHAAVLSMKSGESFNVEMRYDSYADQMHIKLKGNIYGLSHPDKVALIKIDTLNFIYSLIRRNGDKTDEAYFLLAADGKCKLLVKKRAFLKPAEPEKPYQPAVPATFMPAKDTYYLKLNESDAVMVKNKSQVLSVLIDKKDEISKFISSNKLGTRLDDLLKIVQYYNSL